REKEFTRQREALEAERRALPWERVETDYRFDGPDGPCAFADLFRGKSQLVVYHFMFGPDAEVGCPHCSLRADGFDGILVHLAQRDVAFAVVSRAPYAKLAKYQQRMG